MYIAIEGTNTSLNQRIFEYCLKMSEKKWKQTNIFHPLKPMPSYTWWEQAKEKFADNPIFNSELLIARAKYHFKYTGLNILNINNNLVLGIGSIMANIIESWPNQILVMQAHVDHILTELRNLPLPTDIIYVYDSNAKDQKEIEKHQHYLYVFKNLKNYGFEHINIHYIDQSIIESNQMQDYCQQFFDDINHRV